ncbi:MAG: hypothetical protein JWO37_1000 [Acidimicrobiales bacterium]|jgi:hypothetical protein|nr:hypothetical protein [Acidimicrobiales bacterium]
MEDTILDDVSSEPYVVSKEELEAGLTAAYAKAGLVKVNRAGDVVRDTEAMKDRVYTVVSSHIVTNRTEMSQKGKSLTVGELFAAVFPGVPGADPKDNTAEMSPLDAAVREKLKRSAWNLTNPNRKGSIQTRMGKEGRTEVVIRTLVQRGVDEIVGVFVTDNADLILKESVDPMIEKLLSAAKELRLHNKLVVEARHPEIGPQITKMIDIARKRVVAELARPSTNGGSPALPAATVPVIESSDPELGSGE